MPMVVMRIRKLSNSEPRKWQLDKIDFRATRFNAVAAAAAGRRLNHAGVQCGAD